MDRRRAIVGLLVVFLTASLFLSLRLIDEGRAAFVAYHDLAVDVRGFEDAYERLRAAALSTATPRSEIADPELILAWEALREALPSGIDNKALPQFEDQEALNLAQSRVKMAMAELERALVGPQSESGPDFNQVGERIERLRAPTTQLREAADAMGLAPLEHRLFRQLSSLTLFGGSVIFLSGISVFVLLYRQARDSKSLAERTSAAELESWQVRGLLADAVEIISEGFLPLDAQERIVLANTRYKEMYPTISDRIVPDATFQELCMLSAQRRQFSDKLVPEEFVDRRLVQLRNPKGPFEQNLSDGRCLVVKEMRTAYGGTVSLVTDVTGFRRYENLLRERLAAIEASADGIAICDADGRFTYLNEAAVALFGYGRRGELLGRGVAVLFEQESVEMLSQTAMPTMREKGLWRGDARAVNRAGKGFDLELSLTAMGNQGCICVMRDITDRRIADRERERLQSQFYQAQKMEAIGRLAGGIAHDFNNILASILGYAALLIEDLPQDSRELDFARQVFQGGERARELVQQIVDFSRAQVGGKKLIDARDIVEETIELLTATLPATIELTCKMESEPLLLEANETQIGQVLMNLAVNARQAIEQERGKIHIEVKQVFIDGGRARGMMNLPEKAPLGRFEMVSTPQGGSRMLVGVLGSPGPHLKLSVTDDGCGISHDVLLHMFEPFFTTKAQNQGTGLGLAAVHGIVMSHKGALSIDSQRGVGTKINVIIPLAKASAAAIEPRAASKPGLRVRGERVLVVDDEPHVGEVMSIGLRRLGYRVEVAEGGAEGLRLLDFARDTGKPFDIVISDQTMPVMTGAELLHKVKDRYPGLPVILMTGFSETINEEAASAAGAAAFLRKPLDARKMVDIVRLVLDGEMSLGEKPGEMG